MAFSTALFELRLDASLVWPAELVGWTACVSVADASGLSADVGKNWEC
jgi:hypothetical protein